VVLCVAPTKQVVGVTGPPDRGVLERNLTAFVQSGFGQSTQAFIFMTQIEFQVKAGMESFALMLVR
jgi:hypothetical protein